MLAEAQGEAETAREEARKAWRAARRAEVRTDRTKARCTMLLRAAAAAAFGADAAAVAAAAAADRSIGSGGLAGNGFASRAIDGEDTDDGGDDDEHDVGLISRRASGEFDRGGDYDHPIPSAGRDDRPAF
ncbi:hypothetical protein HK405_000668 [Cladochytrium tenue]|nr:hypothetical protein HK405_000668 [Cladochytrium tenue]